MTGRSLRREIFLGAAHTKTSEFRPWRDVVDAKTALPVHARGCRETGGLRSGNCGNGALPAAAIIGGDVLGVDGGGVIRTKPKSLQRPRVGQQPRLPAVIRLVLLHGGLGGCVPLSIRIAGQVVLPDKRLLDLGNPFRRNSLLAMHTMGAPTGMGGNPMRGFGVAGRRVVLRRSCGGSRQAGCQNSQRTIKTDPNQRHSESTSLQKVFSAHLVRPV